MAMASIPCTCALARQVCCVICCLCYLARTACAYCDVIGRLTAGAKPSADEPSPVPPEPSSQQQAGLQATARGTVAAAPHLSSATEPAPDLGRAPAAATQQQAASASAASKTVGSPQAQAEQPHAQHALGSEPPAAVSAPLASNPCNAAQPSVPAALLVESFTGMEAPHVPPWQTSTLSQEDKPADQHRQWWHGLPAELLGQADESAVMLEALPLPASSTATMG